jgi:para-nitrobenzyl esterase
LRLVEAHAAQGGRAYHYLFTYGSPALRGVLGACHALEIPFVFGTLEAPGQARFAGSGPRVSALSRAMMGAWVAFARSGSPACEPLAPWPAFDLTERHALQLDLASQPVRAPFDEERAAWEGIL